MEMNKMRGQTFTVEKEMVIEECCKCGVPFGITKDMQGRLFESHDWFYCPNGHPQHYDGPSDSEKLRKALAEEKRKTSNAQFELMAAEKRIAAEQRKVKRLEKRAKGGACPCCNRQFISVARHMKTQHPDFAKE